MKKYILPVLLIIIFVNSCKKQYMPHIDIEDNDITFEIAGYRNGAVTYGGNILIITKSTTVDGIESIYYISDDKYYNSSGVIVYNEKNYYYLNHPYWKIEGFDTSSTNYSTNYWNSLEEIKDPVDKRVVTALVEELDRRIENGEMILITNESNMLDKDIHYGIFNFPEMRKKDFGKIDLFYKVKVKGFESTLDAP